MIWLPFACWNNWMSREIRNTLLRESALFLSEIVHRRQWRRECRFHLSRNMCARVHELARARARVYAYIYLYTHIYLCVFIFIYKYTYLLISDPNYRVKYRLILKNTHVYVHIQLQHTPGRQESWSSETLIMLLFFLERRSKCTVYIFYILIVSAITILLYT